MMGIGITPVSIGYVIEVLALTLSFFAGLGLLGLIWLYSGSIARFVRRATACIYLQIFPDRLIDGPYDLSSLFGGLEYSLLIFKRLLIECSMQIPGEVADFLRANDLASEHELEKIIQRTVEYFFTDYWTTKRLKEVVACEFGCCPRNILIELELHKEYFVRKSLATNPLVPEVIQEYCTRQCEEYRTKRRSGRYQGWDDFVRDVHANSIAQNGGAA